MARRVVWFAGLSVCLGGALHTRSQAAGADGFQRLTLHIATSSHSPLPLEPLNVTVTLSNNTDQPIRARVCMTPNAGFMKLHVAAPKGPFEKFMAGGWPVTAMPPVQERTFKRGRIGAVDAYLYYDASHGKRRYVLPTPGNYRIKATLEAPDGKSRIESNITTIKVKDPPKEDARAYQFLKDLKDDPLEGLSHGGFLMLVFGGNPGARARRVLDKQEEFLSKFRESRYARYVTWSLGRTYCMRGSKKLARGMLLLERAGDYEGFFQAAKALSVLVEVCVRQGYLEKARRHLATLKAKFPGSKEHKYAAYVVARGASKR